jgi:hypothetical protein
MAVLVKAIKPKKIREKEIRLHLLNEQRKVGTDIKKDFERTVKTWDKKPEFKILVSLAKGQITVAVVTDSEIYRYVDEGTKPHDIWAGFYTGKSDAKVLVFPGTFSAKTIPGVLDARQGSKSGPLVFTPYVRHPGIKARKFSKTIQKKWRKAYKRRMEKALKVGVQKCGHAYP